MSLLGTLYKEPFHLAREMKLGRPPELAPYLSQLRTWIAAQFEVNVLHVEIDYVKWPEGNVPRLRVVLETDSERSSWHPNTRWEIRADIGRSVLEKLRSLAVETGVEEDHSRTFLIVDSFEDACLALAGNSFDVGPSKRFIQDLPALPIWDVEAFFRHTVVFLHTEQDIRWVIKSRWGEQIRRWCFRGNKQFDEFDYLTEQNFHFKFDSKENVDKNFGGCLDRYWH